MFYVGIFQVLCDCNAETLYNATTLFMYNHKKQIEIKT